MLGLTKSWYRNYSGAIKEFGGGSDITIETGTYDGTNGNIAGTTTKTLNFTSAPKILIFYYYYTSQTSYSGGLFIGNNNFNAIYGIAANNSSGGSPGTASATWNVDSITLSGNTSLINYRNYTYYYIGICI